MMLGDSSKSQAKSKKITIARDINTAQPVFLVDLVPGAHLEVLATHELPATESYRSFYRKVVASNLWQRPSPVSSSESTTPTGSNSELTSTTSSSTSLSNGDSGLAGVDSAPSPSSTSTASSSTRTRKRKAGSGRNKNLDPNREIKRRRPRTQVTVPPSTRVLRADGPAV